MNLNSIINSAGKSIFFIFSVAILFLFFILFILWGYKMNETDELLTVNQAAELLQILPHTLNEWRRLKKNLPYLKIGGAVRYRKSDITAFFQKTLIIPKK